jgi:RND family efflux transporter MFP subunit
MKADIRCLIVSLTLGLTLFGCSSPPPPKEREAPRVTVDHPTFRPEVNHDFFTGWLDAVKTIKVQSQVAGELKVDHIRNKNLEGKLVKEGELLFELDPEPFTVEIARADAKVKKFEAEKKGHVQQAEREEGLIKSGGGTQRNLDVFRANADSSEASVKSAQQDVKYYQLQFSYSKIKAPITGTVSKSEIQPGNLVAPGANGTPLTTIVSPDVYVYFNVDERSFQNYQKDRNNDKDKEPTPILFQFKLDTDDGFNHTGELKFKDVRVEKGTGTLLLRGEVKEAKRPLTSGSSVRVRVPVTDKYDALLVPETAILTDQDRKYVLVVAGEKNIVERRDVTLGKLCDDGLRVITPVETGALTDKSQVIVEGLQRARLLYPVQPVPLKKPDK